MIGVNSQSDEKSDIDWHQVARDLTNALEKRNARIAVLERELRDVLDWARTEKAPLRAQEIESIERCFPSGEGK